MRSRGRADSSSGSTHSPSSSITTRSPASASSFATTPPPAPVPTTTASARTRRRPRISDPRSTPTRRAARGATAAPRSPPPRGHFGGLVPEPPEDLLVAVVAVHGHPDEELRGAAERTRPVREPGGLLVVRQPSQLRADRAQERAQS